MTGGSAQASAQERKRASQFREFSDQKQPRFAQANLSSVTDDLR